MGKNPFRSGPASGAWQSNTTWSASDLRVASHLEMVYGGKLDAPTAKALAGKAQRVKYRLRPPRRLRPSHLRHQRDFFEQVQELWRHQPHRYMYPNATERTIYISAVFRPLFAE